jgi:hypothetical protein
MNKGMLQGRADLSELNPKTHCPAFYFFCYSHFQTSLLSTQLSLWQFLGKKLPAKRNGRDINCWDTLEFFWIWTQAEETMSHKKSAF